MCRACSLNVLAYHFDGDQVDEWDIYSDWEIFAIRTIAGEKRRIAEVYLMQGKATVVVPNWWDLIRPEHVADFEPRDHDLVVQSGRDPITGDKIPDGMLIDHAYDESEIPGLDGPRRHRPKQRTMQSVKLVTSR